MWGVGGVNPKASSRDLPCPHAARGTHMSLTSANLVGYLRAEFAKAAKLRIWLFLLQLFAALPAAIAVLIPDRYGDILYWLAVVGAILLLLWWLVNKRYA